LVLYRWLRVRQARQVSPVLLELRQLPVWQQRAWRQVSQRAWSLLV
jgi:hypothetical protein